MNVYLSNMPPPLAKERSDKLMGAGMDQITFTWAGSPEIGEAHYYRIQGPTFLIEYDNIQNNANHIHAVYATSTATSAGIFSGSIIRTLIKHLAT